MDFNKNNNKKILIPVLAVALLVVATLGATYAFFNYTRTGDRNTVTTGTINFSSNQTNNNLTLTNVFPIASSSVLTDTNNVAEIDINVTGDTTYSGGMEYKLTIVNPVLTATANNETVTLPLSFVIDADTTDGTLTGLGTEQSTYFDITSTNKTNGTYPSTAMYKRMAGTTPDTVKANKDIFVGYIPARTSVNGKIKIKAFLDAGRILITDTPSGNDVATDGFENGTDTSGYDVVVTTGQWNALHTSPLSFQVKVESNEGLWVENPNTLYNAVKLMSRGTMNNATDFGTVASSDTTNHPYGVYQLVESNLTNPIYFFRGDHTVKNNVIFDNKCWLVVRTTETNSVRMLYNGTPENGQCTTTTGNDTMISLYQSDNVNADGNYDYSYTSKEGFTTLISGANFLFNVNRDSAKYVGYTYDSGTSSNMKNALEAWYEGAISSEAKGKIETSAYCNDTTDVSETYKSTYNINNTSTFFGGILRARANTPSVVCPNGANVINSKVGFLTIDEEILAGRTWSTGMQDYLYNNSYWWLGSPSFVMYGNAYEFVVLYSYDVNSSDVWTGNGLRPVVSITSNTSISGGDGSQGTPWIIS